MSSRLLLPCEGRHRPAPDANPAIPWRSMIGMRNVLAHGYFDLDPAVIAAVVDRDVPGIARRITEILEHS